MRLKVRQETLYKYAAPAHAAIQLLRLTPRNYEGQFVKKWRVEVDADYRLTRDEDPFGNITHTFSIEGPIEEMRVVVEGEVDTFDVNGLVRGSAERLPCGFWLRESALTQPDPAIKDMARDVANAEGGDILATAHALMAAIHRQVTYKAGETTPHTSAAEAFKEQAGVCQDLAQIYVAAARSIDIPARYVGGYFLLENPDVQKTGHAWAEAYIAGIGWIGFDPAHNVCVTDRYIRVATGLDSRDAAPVRGSRIGGDGETMNVAVHVTAGRMLVEG